MMYDRFGISRFTTEEEVDYTAQKCVDQVNRLREMRYALSSFILSPLSIYIPCLSNHPPSIHLFPCTCPVCVTCPSSVSLTLTAYSPLWDMVQEGIDLKTIQWSQH